MQLAEKPRHLQSHFGVSRTLILPREASFKAVQLVVSTPSMVLHLSDYDAWRHSDAMSKTYHFPAIGSYYQEFLLKLSEG